MTIGRSRRWLVGAFMIGIIGITGVKPVSAVYQLGDHVANFTLRNWDNQWVSLYNYNDRIVVLAFWFAT
jgi:hypothetical protein